MAMRKRRTPAQIRATKKLVALNKKRARHNVGKPNRRRPSSSARRMKRADRALSKWVRSGMPSQRNRTRRKRSTRCNPGTITLKQAQKLAKAARRGSAVGITGNRRSGYRVVTGKAARKLGRRS